MLTEIQFTLIGTTHPGNIGGVARAMKCMGLSRLNLVSPRYFPHPDATSRASGAGDILQEARVFDGLNDAVEKCVFVAGTTARARNIEWPMVEPRVAAERILTEAERGPVTVLFGRENSGLSNKEVDRCSLLIRIPTATQYASLNLASAAQIMAYELRLAFFGASEVAQNAQTPADQASMALFYRHLEQVLYDIDFVKTTSSERLMRKLVRMYNRAQPTAEEINILRGILTATVAIRRS